MYRNYLKYISIKEAASGNAPKVQSHDSYTFTLPLCFFYIGGEKWHDQ